MTYSSLSAKCPRKLLVRLSLGFLSTFTAGPCSTISPPSMKITLSATSRANSSSCVTIIEVMRCFDMSLMILRTSCTFSGSRAL